MSNASHLPIRLTRSTGTALHRQLYIVLRDQIVRGVFAVGTTIPNEAELEALFGVSRITVRRAVADLEMHGLVRKLPGKGTFVLPRQAHERPEATLSLMESLIRQAKDTQVKVLSVETMTAPGDIVLMLELGAETRAHHVLRLRVAGDLPLMVTEAWVRISLAPYITRESLLESPLFEIILRNGVKFGKVVQEISAVAADPQHASLLNTDVGSPLTRRTRLFFADDGRPVYHLVSYVVPERTRLLMEIPADAIDTLSSGHFQHTAIL